MFSAAIRNSRTTTAHFRVQAIHRHLSSPTRTMASIPKTMKGIIIHKTGGTDVLEYKTDLPVPEPKEGEVLVKNDFIGINYIDTYFRTGLYPAPFFPYILGREAAGTIVSVGPSTDAKPIPSSLKTDGKAVYLAQQSYAEYTAASATHTFALPDGVDTKTGAASLLQGLTALTLIRDAHNVKKGDWVLVHAAAGGMGLWLCQLLKGVGARTIATASSEAKRELARKAGAEVLLEYPKDMGGDEAFGKKIKEITGGPGVAVVFDGVGKATFDASLQCVARKGSLISFGNASGAVEPLNIARLSASNVKLMRPTLFNFIATREEFETDAKALYEIIQKEGVDVRIHEVFDLKDAARAQDALEGRSTTGKLLLKP